MKEPDIPHTIKDSTGKITYKVMAYRNLSRDEVVLAVQNYNSRVSKSKRAKSGLVIINTTFS